MTYPQRPGPPPPYGGPYGYAPPPKKRTGLVVGLIMGVVALLLVAGFVITAFVAPGFLLSKPKNPGPPQRPPLSLSQASDTADRFIKDLASGSPYTTADDIACANDRDGIINEAGAFIIGNAKLQPGTPVMAGDDAITVPLTGTFKDKPYRGELTVKRQTSDYAYCVSAVVQRA